MSHVIFRRSFAAAVLLAAVTAPAGANNKESESDKPATKVERYWAIIGNDSPEFERGDENH